MRIRDILLIALAAILVLGVVGLIWYGGSHGWFVGPQGPKGDTGDKGDQGPPGPTAEVVVQATPSAEATEEGLTTGEDGGELRLGKGAYINWVDSESAEFLQADGTYLVPVSYLAEKAPGAGVLIFEGEFWNTIGKHNVCILVLADPDYPNQCPTKEVDGELVFHTNQDSFWGYPIPTEGGDLPDDILMAFAHDKWKNWQEQGKKGNPIFAWVSTGTMNWAAGVEPALSAEQIVLVDLNAQDRCPADEPEKLETPYSDSSGGHQVVGAPGSFACRTLFVGYLSDGSDLVAYYWRGARDGFGYWSEDSWFYLIPESWGANEIQAFVTENFGDAQLQAK